MHEVLIALTLISGFLFPNFDTGQNIILSNYVNKNYDVEIKNQNIEKEKDSLQIGIPTTPIKNPDTNSIPLQSKAVLAIDLDSNNILFDKNKDTKLSIASLTKLMTAFIILKENNPNEIVQVPILNNHQDDSTMGIIEGEKISIYNLLCGLLINSGSDSAQTLAIQNAGSIDAFVVKMNNYSEELGLNNTNFSNPVGWDDENNYSSANDIANLTKILLRNTNFKDIIKNKYKTVYTEEGRAINLTNTNKLLDGTSFLGVKTGYTFGAGECLVSLNKQDSKETLTVVIGSSNRFSETQILKEWIYNTYSW